LDQRLQFLSSYQKEEISVADRPMKRRLTGAVVFCLCLTVAFSQARAQANPYQVYFVTIGSGWYATSSD